MKIKVNGRFLAHRPTGVEEYARAIIQRLAGELEIAAPARPLQGPRGHLWEQSVLPSRLQGALLWSPCNTGPLAVERQVLTIHDCAFADLPHCFSKAFAAWYNWLVPRLARRVRKIITVSCFSKGRIVERCRVPPEKVEVVSNGVDPQFQPCEKERIAALRSRHGLPDRYVLCVASMDPRKNLRRLVEAWMRLPENCLQMPLVIAGAGRSTFAEVNLPGSDRRLKVLGYVAGEDLPPLYAGATLFAYVSLYEGFGLPVLEAMACGTPVICSGTTSLPEVAGDAAVLVDPSDDECIGRAILDLAQDDSKQQALRAAGLQRAATFTWDRAAADTLRVFRAAE
ncbi:MAG: glycosyltransferase family 1 protein [Thermoguttaceae bacterium]|jgi:glycosyltransferase involved in cell wall biosynthesis